MRLLLLCLLSAMIAVGTAAASEARNYPTLEIDNTNLQTQILPPLTPDQLKQAGFPEHKDWLVDSSLYRYVLLIHDDTFATYENGEHFIVRSPKRWLSWRTQSVSFHYTLMPAMDASTLEVFQKAMKMDLDTKECQVLKKIVNLFSLRDLVGIDSSFSFADAEKIVAYLFQSKQDFRLVSDIIDVVENTVDFPVGIHESILNSLCGLLPAILNYNGGQQLSNFQMDNLTRIFQKRQEMLSLLSNAAIVTAVQVAFDQNQSRWIFLMLLVHLRKFEDLHSLVHGVIRGEISREVLRFLVFQISKEVKPDIQVKLFPDDTIHSLITSPHNDPYVIELLHLLDQGVGGGQNWQAKVEVMEYCNRFNTVIVGLELFVGAFGNYTLELAIRSGFSKLVIALVYYGCHKGVLTDDMLTQTLNNVIDIADLRRSVDTNDAHKQLWKKIENLEKFPSGVNLSPVQLRAKELLSALLHGYGILAAHTSLSHAVIQWASKLLRHESLDIALERALVLDIDRDLVLCQFFPLILHRDPADLGPRTIRIFFEHILPQQVDEVEITEGYEKGMIKRLSVSLEKAQLRQKQNARRSKGISLRSTFQRLRHSKIPQPLLKSTRLQSTLSKIVQLVPPALMFIALAVGWVLIWRLPKIPAMVLLFCLLLTLLIMFLLKLPRLLPFNSVASKFLGLSLSQ